MNTVLTENTIEIVGGIESAYASLLSPEALAFITKLHQSFNPRRKELLANRQQRQAEIKAGKLPHFLPETLHIRQSDWKAADTLADIQDRRVEITGPVDKKMVINALNSGAKVFMADFEDSNAPTRQNCFEGQINLQNAIRRTLDFTAENGKRYTLNEKTAVLMVRPRGWHLEDKNVLIDGAPVSGGILDFGLYFFHNAHTLIEKGTAPYFYLPKMESHLEARLWNDIFVMAQDLLQIPQGTIKATVLIETIMAAFEMEEIIYELRQHIAGLNAGRWDYIFSCIKKFIYYPEKRFPDRVQVTMSVPFMRAYAKLLVKTCHKRNVHAMGGMSAFIPSRKDEEINKNAFAKVRADKELEVSTGFDGTWVAHPDLVAVAQEVFDNALGQKKNQKDETLSQQYQIEASELIDFKVEGGKITEAGVRMNINVGILYMASWLNGVGAAAIHNLMEDAATAEISRAQLWQWIHHPQTTLDNGNIIDRALYDTLFADEVQKLQNQNIPHLEKAAQLFNQLVIQENFEEFLTINAYQYL